MFAKLEASGLLRRAPGGGRNATPYDVTRAGFDYYDALMRGSGTPIAGIETTVRRYLDSDGFASRYGGAYAKWRQADDERWGEDTDRRMTTVGHYLREAMMAFAAEAVERYVVTDAPADPVRTVDRLRAVIGRAKPNLSTREAPLLDALVVYWGTVHDLVARQEHGVSMAT
jgi:hypothetical protein